MFDHVIVSSIPLIYTELDRTKSPLLVRLCDLVAPLVLFLIASIIKIISLHIRNFCSYQYPSDKNGYDLKHKRIKSLVQFKV